MPLVITDTNPTTMCPFDQVRLPEAARDVLRWEAQRAAKDTDAAKRFQRAGDTAGFLAEAWAA